MNIERVNLLISTADKLRQHGERFKNILTEIDRELLEINNPEAKAEPKPAPKPVARAIPSSETEVETEEEVPRR